MHKATLFENVEGETIRCVACNNFCIIKNKDSGICGVRKNVGGQLYLMVYGQAAAVNIDPMEKKPLYHFLPGEKILTIGTIGCNFGCSFCQNWSISQATKDVKLRKIPFDAIFKEHGYDLPPKEVIKICLRDGIKAVAFSYNEPVIFFEYAFDIMKLAKKHGIKSVFVSNGYESEQALDKMKGYLDAMNIDLKAFTEKFYMKVCHARLAPVLETIKKVHARGIWLEITTLLIPGENDSPEEIERIVNFIAGVDRNIPWHISAFHPDYKMLGKQSTPHATLINAYELGKKKLNYVYVGNVVDHKRSTTYCSTCGEKIIERRNYHMVMVGLKEGKCGKCGEKVPGIFA